MGQRTAIIIVAKDKDNKVVVRTYHDQWGIGRKMPLALMSLYNRLYNRPYGKTITETAYIDPSQHNISLEFEMVYPTGKELGKAMHHDIYMKDGVLTDDVEAATRANHRSFIYWDYIPKKVSDWENPKQVQEFINGCHDNNNGALVVFLTPNPEVDWQTPSVKIGWLRGEEDRGRLTDKGMNQWMSTEEYLSLGVNKSYADSRFRKMFRYFLDYFEVKEVKTGKVEGAEEQASASKVSHGFAGTVSEE